jgi:hypothetical protein
MVVCWELRFVEPHYLSQLVRRFDSLKEGLRYVEDGQPLRQVGRLLVWRVGGGYLRLDKVKHVWSSRESYWERVPAVVAA